ncbi:MAG: NAD(P)-dependent oxidoreductase [Methylobacteriaceae bacterium]|nr:NAD(P)-dependent oxidoreductase [Methylobacteriaceae bacterium]
MNNEFGVCFIGFGEVGQTFAAGLGGREGVRLHAYDRLFGSRRGAALEAAAARLGVAVFADAAAAARSCDIVFSAVTADQTLAAAEEAAAYLAAGQLFVDLNSAAPTTKQAAAARIAPSGGAYVEAAVMAPVLKPGLRVPILAGGPDAWRAAELLNRLGLNVTPAAREFGRASAIKLCRSIVIKGLEALMIDCAAACAAWDVADPVFASLAASYPSIDWAELARDMGERVATHGARRAAEMREAAEMAAAAGLDPALIAAIAAAQARGARPKE